jgi:hypothetical protein
VGEICLETDNRPKLRVKFSPSLPRASGFLGIKPLGTNQRRKTTGYWDCKRSHREFFLENSYEGFTRITGASEKKMNGYIILYN